MKNKRSPKAIWSTFRRTSYTASLRRASTPRFVAFASRSPRPKLARLTTPLTKADDVSLKTNGTDDAAKSARDRPDAQGMVRAGHEIVLGEGQLDYEGLVRVARNVDAIVSISADPIDAAVLDAGANGSL